MAEPFHGWVTLDKEDTLLGRPKRSVLVNTLNIAKLPICGALMQRPAQQKGSNCPGTFISQ